MFLVEGRLKRKNLIPVGGQVDLNAIVLNFDTI